MADDKDDSQKDLPPSQRKLDDARRRGQVVSSKEVTNALLFGAAFAIIAALAPWMATDLAFRLRRLLVDAHTLSDTGVLGPALIELLGAVGLAMAPLLVLLVLVPIAATLGQGAFVWSTEQITPKFERISPLSGLSRLFSPKALVEFGKGLLKLAVIGGVGAGLLWVARDRLLTLDSLAIGHALGWVEGMALRLVAAAAAITSLIAVLDYLHRRFEFMREMRMTRQEAIEDQRQSDGDPAVKQRLRAIRLERARRRMMADVPRSTVIITNPTHFAVALRYVAGETAAPLVLAKGVDDVALKIREIARQHAVPIIENPPLARALHRAVEIGDAIPPAHFQAVAEVISFVLRLGSTADTPPAPL